jgi:hypothetical protein
MAKIIKEITDILKKEKFAKEFTQYYREVEINGRWRLFDVLDDTLLAYSVIKSDVELLVVINCNCEKEITNKVTVDRNLTPAGSKLSDIAGRPKKFNVDEFEGRNFVTVTLKPNSFSILKKS